MGLSRRDFLASAVGAGGGLALLKVPVRRLVGLDDVHHHTSVPEVERWVRSTCLLCPGGCGIEVRKLDGLPVSIKGNALHPINRGGLCAMGVEGLHALYHPDRIRGPLKRAGDRGENNWVQISWEEAIAEVAARLGELVGSGRADSIVFLDGFARGLMSRLSGRFVSALGSPHHVLDTPASGLLAMMELAQGVPQLPAYDLENAEYVLSFGAPLLEGWRSPLQGQGAYAALRGAKEGRRRRLVQIDTRLSKTANRADRFIPVKPGGYGALALCIAYVLIREELYDADFLAAHGFGFETGSNGPEGRRRGFRDHVLYHYRPDRMQEVTGVPSAVVTSLAKEFAAAGSGVAVVDHASTLYSNGVQTALAVQALNALVGSIDRPGGVLVSDEVPWAEWPAIPVPGAGGDPSASGSASRHPLAASTVASLPGAILSQGRDVGALFLNYSNPCFSTPDPDRFARALARIPFVVSFTPLPDDTSHYADLILPDHTYLERWQDAVAPSSFPYAVLGLTQPAVEPLYDTRHTGDVLLGIARKMGGPVAEALPWSSFEDVLRESTRSVFEAGRGTVLADEHTSAEVRQLEMRGWWIPRHEAFGEFWEDFIDKGGWWDPAYVHGLWGRVLQTPSRRYEFHSQKLEQIVRVRLAGGTDPGSLRSALDSLGIQGDAEGAFLPHHETAVFDGFRGERDFHLNLFRPLVPSSGLMADLPWVREILNPRVAWDLWAEIHPEDAASLGIVDGEAVWLTSPVGRIAARALVGHEAQRGVVNVPYGLGRRMAGRWGRTRGANPNRLVPGELEPLAGIPMWLSTMVRIERRREGDTHG